MNTKQPKKPKNAKNAQSGPSPLFDKAFEDSCVLLNAEEQLKCTYGRSMRARLIKTIARRNSWLDRRTKRHQEINRLTSQYISLHEGEIAKVADLIKYLRENGVQVVQERSEGPHMTERALRIHLKNAFGIGGRPGRKLS